MNNQIPTVTPFRYARLSSLMSFLASAVLSICYATEAQKNPAVGGAAEYPTKNIIENAVNSPIHKTLVAAVKAAGLVDALSGPGPFTVFAPTDDAFAKLPAGTVDTLVKPENKASLTDILTYHVVAGKISTKELVNQIKKSGGRYEMTTAEGGTLMASTSGGKIILTDEKGGTATITIADVYQSNGIIQVIDSVLMPNGSGSHKPCNPERRGNEGGTPGVRPCIDR